MATSRELRLTPVVAFDVDGVLRIRKLKPIPEGFTSLGPRPEQDIFPVEITFTQDAYPDIYHGKPKWNEDGRSEGTDYFSQVGAAFLQELQAEIGVEPVWATTWQRWANHYFGEALGLTEDLPVAVRTLEPDHLNYAHCSPSWKTRQLARQFDGRPLIWLDDNMPDRPYEDLTGQRRPVDRALTRSYRVDPITGITPEDVLEIRAWLDLASTPQGQLQLRQERREMLAEQRRARLQETRRRDRRYEIMDQVKAKVLELYPGQDHFARDVASMAQSRTGLVPENLGYALKRHSLKGGPEALSAALRIPRYHLRELPPEDTDFDLDF